MQYGSVVITYKGYKFDVTTLEKRLSMSLIEDLLRLSILGI